MCFKKRANKLFEDTSECEGFERASRYTYVCEYVLLYIYMYLVPVYVMRHRVLPTVTLICVCMRTPCYVGCQGHRCHNVAAGLPEALYGKGD